MSSQPISRFKIPKIEDIPQDIRSKIFAIQEKAGFVPNATIPKIANIRCHQNGKSQSLVKIARIS